MQNECNNNAEKIIMGLDELFKDIDNFPDGEIKQSLEKIKIKAKEIDSKNNKNVETK